MHPQKCLGRRQHPPASQVLSDRPETSHLPAADTGRQRSQKARFRAICGSQPPHCASTSTWYHPRIPWAFGHAPLMRLGALGRRNGSDCPSSAFTGKKPEISQTAGTKMVVSQSIFMRSTQPIPFWNPLNITNPMHTSPCVCEKVVENATDRTSKAIFETLQITVGIMAQRATNQTLIPTSYCIPQEPKY